MNEKTTKRSCKAWFKDFVLLHPILLMIIVLSVAVLLALVVSSIAVWLDSGKWSCGFAYLFWQLEKIEDGLSLLASYVGAIATVELGIIALWFSFKTEQREIIGKLQDIQIESINLYDMFENFVPSEQLYEGTRGFQFLLKIVLSKKSPEYELSINEVKLGLCGRNDEIEQESLLCGSRCYVESAAKTVISVFFDETEFANGGQTERRYDKKSTSFFYHIYDYEPLLMDKSLRQRWINMNLDMKEKVWFQKKHKWFQKRKDRKRNIYNIDFKILVENRAREEKNDYINLSVIRHTVEVERLQ